MLRKPAVFVFDVDGTLASFGMPVKRSVSERLCSIENAGHTICLASGKPCAYLAGLSRGIGLTGSYIIGENGAAILQDKKPVQLIASRPAFFEGLQRDISRVFPTAYFQENYINITVFADSKDTLDAIGMYLQKSGYENDNSILVFMHQDAVEILPRDVNKGSALKKLKSLPSWQSKEIIAAGDSDNDLGMCEVADHFYAVGKGLKRAGVNRFADIESLMEHLWSKYADEP